MLHPLKAGWLRASERRRGYDVTARKDQEEGAMQETIFMICMFFGVASVALIAFTLLWIALGKIRV